MVILYNPPSSAQRKPVLPLSLLALGAVLEGECDYHIVDGNLSPDPLLALDQAIRETQSNVLAVTVMPGPQLSHAVPHCRRLRQLHPQLKVVWGGYFPTQHYDVCLRSGLVDFVVRGHGEMTFKNLLVRLRDDLDPHDLVGLAYRSDTDQIVSNQMPSLPDPNALPDYPYHRLDMRRYVRKTFMGRTLSHHSSYGCPFFCNFCAVVNMVNGRWRAQSAQRTAETTRSLVSKWGTEAVEFLDNNFFVDESRVAEFSEQIMDLNLSWWGEARIDTLLRFSDTTWDLMARSGLRMVFLGAESGSDETLRRMKKGGRACTEKTLEIAEKTARYSIIPEFSFVLGNPPDPEGDVDQTLRFIRQVKQVNPHSEIILYLYTPVPLAGDLYEGVRNSGFDFPSDLEDWISSEWHEFSLRRSRKLRWLEPRLRTRIRNFERVLNAYYPTSTDPKLGRFWRLLLKTFSGWRYHLNFYTLPLELRVLQRWLRYQRPETSGF